MRPSVSPARTTPPSCPDLPGLVPGIRASTRPPTLARSSRVMPGPARTCPDSFRVSGYPAISIGRARRRAVDARNESGHDGVREWPGREASHPETETGFRESLILMRDSPGLSGISGILRASILFEKLPSARPMFPHRAPCARGLTNVMAGLVPDLFTRYPAIHPCTVFPRHARTRSGHLPQQAPPDPEKCVDARNESGHDGSRAWAGREERLQPTD